MKTLAATFVMLNMADLGLTFLAVELGATEFNPVVRLLLDQPEYAVIAYKALLSVGFAAAMVWLRMHFALATVTLIMAGVCVFNTTNIFIMESIA